MQCSGTQGYSLEQLLSWSMEDSLIDGYERAGDLLVISRGRRRHVLPITEASGFLKRIFREHRRGPARLGQTGGSGLSRPTRPGPGGPHKAMG